MANSFILAISFGFKLKEYQSGALTTDLEDAIVQVAIPMDTMATEKYLLNL